MRLFDAPGDSFGFVIFLGMMLLFGAVAAAALSAREDRPPIAPTTRRLVFVDDADAGVRCYDWANGESVISCVVLR